MHHRDAGFGLDRYDETRRTNLVRRVLFFSSTLHVAGECD